MPLMIDGATDEEETAPCDMLMRATGVERMASLRREHAGVTDSATFGGEPSGDLDDRRLGYAIGEGPRS